MEVASKEGVAPIRSVYELHTANLCHSFGSDHVNFDSIEVLGRSQGPTVQGYLTYKNTHPPRTIP